MRSINLLKVAAQAELVRLRILLARQGRRAAFGVVAVIFVVGVLGLAEVTGWQVLRLYVAAISATLILLGFNFVIAVVFGLRRQALDTARGALALTAAVPIVSALLQLRRRRDGRRRLFGPLGRRLHHPVK